MENKQHGRNEVIGDVFRCFRCFVCVCWQAARRHDEMIDWFDGWIDGWRTDDEFIFIRLPASNVAEVARQTVRASVLIYLPVELILLTS